MKEKKQYIKPEILVEEWKVYKETGGYMALKRVYEVSNFGRVKINGIITEPYSPPNGYKYIGPVVVHRAVAELFIPNPENKRCVDHIDTNKQNNMIWNLRWVTHKENTNNPLTLKHNRKVQNSQKTKRKKSNAMMGNKNAKDHIWVNKNGTGKMVKVNQLESFLNDGWKLGRNYKKRQYHLDTVS